MIVNVVHFDIERFKLNRMKAYKDLLEALGEGATADLEEVIGFYAQLRTYLVR